MNLNEIDWNAPDTRAQRMLQFSLDQAPDAVFWMTEDAGFVYVNDQACRSLGYTRKELLRLHLWDIDPVHLKSTWERNWGRHASGEVVTRQIETRHRRKDGTVFPVEVSSRHFRVDDTEFHVSFVRDITERKNAEAEKAKLEAQLLQAQKMEAIGQLAGGVAHDFNNILTAILGYVELGADSLGEAVKADHPVRTSLREVERGAVRAAALTSQLLAFSRKQVSNPRVLDINHTLRDMEKMLGPLLTEDVQLITEYATDLQRVFVDSGQIEQVLLNLVVNARDAMPDGGKLVVATSAAYLDDAYCETRPEVNTGEYVLLTVSDTGCGMDAETAAHVFEPFYTTKEVGKGTGLGLSTVYGIVKQAGGHVAVYSEPDRGCTFRVYLPAVDAKTAEPRPVHGAGEVQRGTETILLCEDDSIVCDLTARILRTAGYEVLPTHNAAQAQAVAGKHAGKIDLLLTDVILPDTNGKKLAQAITGKNTGLRVLYISGYTANVIAHHGVLDSGVEFLEKPFTRKHLLERIREVLATR